MFLFLLSWRPSEGEKKGPKKLKFGAHVTERGGAQKLFGQCTNTDYQKGVSLSDWQLKKVNDRTTRLLLAVLVLFVLAELPQVTGQLYFSWFLAVKMWATLHFFCWNNNASKNGDCSKRQKNQLLYSSYSVKSLQICDIIVKGAISSKHFSTWTNHHCIT